VVGFIAVEMTEVEVAGAAEEEGAVATLSTIDVRRTEGGGTTEDEVNLAMSLLRIDRINQSDNDFLSRVSLFQNM
jgi:hypothetical protein